MISAMDSAISGLNAAGKRLEVSANNIANQFSSANSANSGSAQAVSQPFIPQAVDQVSLSGGGVMAQSHDVNPPSVTEADADSPTGLSQAPNVDQATELLNMNSAAYDFKANLKTIQVQEDVQQSLLDIFT